MPTVAVKKEKWVIQKGNLFANVNHAFGGRPKVYDSMRGAQFDITHHLALKGGTIRPYTGQEVVKIPGFATTDKAKAMGTAAPRPARKAADGLPSATTKTGPAIKPKVKPLVTSK